MNKFRLPARFPVQKESVWEEYIAIANKYKPLDLGQGFPDYAPPEHVTRNLREVANSEDSLLHQYTREHGHPRLVCALSKLYSRLLGRIIDPHAEILVTGGAYEALFCGVCGFVDEGDEVVIIEPFFDCYEPLVLVSGGRPRFIPLRLKDSKWGLDSEELQAVFNERTKLFILNTPHNPTGKVFTESELRMIADLCVKWNVVCLSDEVYEWAVYDQTQHVRMASLPGMWERTITICSAGKTFGITGWKIGWCYGPNNLLKNVRTVHQRSVYMNPTPAQEALAMIIEHENSNTDKSYLTTLSQNLQVKRDHLIQSLKLSGLNPITPEGGYFMLVDYSTYQKSELDLSGFPDEFKDYRFTKWLVGEIGVLGIPSTAFYHAGNKRLSENYFRLCFVKNEETLEKVRDALKRLNAVCLQNKNKLILID